MHRNLSIRVISIAVVTVFTFASGNMASAQIAFGGKALGLTPGRTLLAPLRTVTLPTVDREALLAEDAVNLALGIKGPFRFGFNHAVDVDMNTDGSWTTLRNGDRVWWMGIRCPEAFSINFIFSEYVVPEGASVFVYNDAGQQLGAFTANSNGGRPTMGVTQLPGDHITIEYQEPVALAGEGRLHISQVTHGYRDIFGMLRDLGDSGSCNINVICPDGDEWRDQIRAVAMCTTNGSGFCTGTLMNNCAEDGTPYFLTANHCLDPDVANWTFRFNWDSPDCDPTVNGPIDQTVSGCQLLVNSGGTDVALLQLNTAPPEEYEVFYSGWDHSTTPSLNMTGIHHPRGDIKKISHSNGAAVLGTFSGADCWRVSLWDDGTTEPGSSGSGLWNQNKHLVGQLFGGAANCANSVDDYYGRLDVSWPLLEEWLGGTCGDTLGGFGGTIVIPIVFNGAVTSITNIAALQCGEDTVAPRITYKNNGTVPLTSALFTYWIEGGPTFEMPWTGALQPDQTVNIQLPAIPVVTGLNLLSVVCSAPNGGMDQAPLDDTLTYTFNASVPSAIVSLLLTLDNYGEDITWNLATETGTELYQGGPYPNFHNGEVDSVAFCLTNGCYTFTILDGFGDGICCTEGDGSYLIRDTDGVIHAENDGQYGAMNVDQFCFVGVSIPDGARHTTLHIVPNPSHGVFHMDLSSIEGPVRYSISDAIGRSIAHGQLQGGSDRALIDLRSQLAGIYHITVSARDGRWVERLVIE